MTVTLKDLGDTLSTAQKMVAELAAAQNPAPTPIPDKPVGSLPLDTTIRGAFDKTLILPYSSLILAGQVVIQLATGQAVNVISIGRRDNGDLTAVIDQSIGDPSKVIGKAATVRERYGKPDTAPVPQPVPETPVVTPPVAEPDPITVPGVAVLKNIPYLGINLAAHSNANQVLPGEAGTHFKWPSRADVRLYVRDLGVRLLRFPYALQRATLTDSTGLPVKGGQLDPTFVAKMKTVLGWIREDSNGEALVIFDPHHYWRMYRNQTALVDGVRKQTGALLPA
ncbi:MAG TPA: hypothetical protein K8U87_22680, partial [Pseudomonas oryzihabitans]|nr:hypothetical protein [Pseudomonas oryzihabitans]